MLTAFAGQDPKQEPAQDNAPVTVENFGKVNDHIYRGGQPKGEEYRRLGALGIKTILDLRGDNEPSAKSLTEGAGMRYINLPLAPKQYPQPDAAQRFLEIVNDQSNWPVYVHCAGGRHRSRLELADDFLPPLRVGRNLIDRLLVEHEARCVDPGAMTRRAIFGDRCARLLVYRLNRSGCLRVAAQGEQWQERRHRYPE